MTKQPGAAQQAVGRGEARSNGPAYTSILSSDRTPPPAPLAEEAYEWLEADQVDIARYTSQEYHDLEAAKLWPSTWQMACRVENIPNVGDHVVYEICDQSLIVVRIGDDDAGRPLIKAFHNSCLHRGTTLVQSDGNTALFKCRFHGFAWSLDGSFRGMPPPGTSPTSTARTSVFPRRRLPCGVASSWSTPTALHHRSRPTPLR